MAKPIIVICCGCNPNKITDHDKHEIYNLIDFKKRYKEMLDKKNKEG